MFIYFLLLLFLFKKQHAFVAKLFEKHEEHGLGLDRGALRLGDAVRKLGRQANLWENARVLLGSLGVLKGDWFLERFLDVLEVFWALLDVFRCFLGFDGVVEDNVCEKMNREATLEGIR